MVLITRPLVVQNATLHRQLSDLRQRYTRAKQAMKAAQERLDVHNRKKEELMRQQRRKNDEAIIAESQSFHFLPESCAQHLNVICSLLKAHS